MPNLVELQLKYPTAKYEPNPNCKRCNGEGVWWHEIKPHESNGMLESGYRCCMCIFVAPEYMEVARDVLNKTISIKD